MPFWRVVSLMDFSEKEGFGFTKVVDDLPCCIAYFGNDDTFGSSHNRTQDFGTFQGVRSRITQ